MDEESFKIHLISTKKKVETKIMNTAKTIRYNPSGCNP